MNSINNQIESLESFEVEYYSSETTEDHSWEDRYTSLKILIQSDAGDPYKLRELKEALNDTNTAIRYLAANSLKSLNCLSRRS